MALDYFVSFTFLAANQPHSYLDEQPHCPYDVMVAQRKRHLIQVMQDRPTILHKVSHCVPPATENLCNYYVEFVPRPVSELTVLLWSAFLYKACNYKDVSHSAIYVLCPVDPQIVSGNLSGYGFECPDKVSTWVQFPCRVIPKS